MENQNTEGLLHPSVLQIRYLTELARIGKKRGSVALIADTCGVSHGPVSRFFKECIGAGYLTETYEFTEKGSQALKTYQRIMREVGLYLERIGIPDGEISEKTRQLVENVDYSLIMTMTRNSGQVQESRNQTAADEGTTYYLEKVLDKGRFEVGIAIYQLNTASGTKLSMANNGFAHMACIRNNTRGSWLELTTKEMHAHSRINGADMAGRLSSLKYEEQGQLFEAVIREGKVRIPLNACHFMKTRHGNVKGMIPITVTCSVGKAHMPESTALLMFWM